jgi:hypothetical protein
MRPGSIPPNVLAANRHNRDFAQCVERVRILISGGMSATDAAVQALHERGVEPVIDLVRVVREMVKHGE